MDDHKMVRLFTEEAMVTTGIPHDFGGLHISGYKIDSWLVS